MLREQPNHDRRKFLCYAGFLTLAVGLAAVFDRCLLRNQDAPDSMASSITIYSIFIFLGLISASLFSGKEGNGFGYLFSCDCRCLFRMRIQDQRSVTEETPLASAPAPIGSYGSCN